MFLSPLIFCCFSLVSLSIKAESIALWVSQTLCFLILCLQKSSALHFLICFVSSFIVLHLTQSQTFSNLCLCTADEDIFTLILKIILFRELEAVDSNQPEADKMLHKIIIMLENQLFKYFQTWFLASLYQWEGFHSINKPDSHIIYKVFETFGKLIISL